MWDVAAQGTTAYLAAGTGGVRVVDLADPTAPVEIAQLPTEDWAWDLEIDGTRLYVADIDGGLHIIDITAPMSPRRLSTTVSGLGVVTSVTVSGKHAIVTTDDAAAIIDVEDPAAPAVRATYPTAGTPQDVAVADTVLVTDLAGGLRMLDSTDIAVTASHSPPFAEPGDAITIQLTVINEGPSSAQDIVMTTTLPADLVFASASPACDETAGVVTCALGELAHGAAGTITASVTAPTMGGYDVTAVVTSEATEIYLPNNMVTRRITVQGEVSRTHLPLVIRAP